MKMVGNKQSDNLKHFVSTSHEAFILRGRPREICGNQIGLSLINENFRNAMKRARTYQDADCDSDQDQEKRVHIVTIKRNRR